MAADANAPPAAASCLAIGAEGRCIVVGCSDGKLHMPSRGVLAGSASTTLQCMNHLHSLRLLSKGDFVLKQAGDLIGGAAKAQVASCC